MPPTSLFLILTLLTFYIIMIKGFEHECGERFMQCDNGRCVAVLWRCDGEDDCGDMTDEKNCENPTHIKCDPRYFQCQGDGRCITVKWQCDGEHDCEDGSDERNCTTSPCDGFRCPDNHCIPKRWECDGQRDCLDGADEKSCHMEKVSLCDKDEFLCTSGLCIWDNKTCDGNKDCADGSDEGDHCKDECQNMTCGQICVRTPLGAKCHCRSGYKLAQDNVTCDDIDECVEGFCSQNCKNLNGSYECSCLPGYDLKENGTCHAHGGDPVLLFTTKTHIRAMYLRSKIYFPIHDAVEKSAAVDVDPKDSRIYWTDLSRLGSSVYSTYLDGTGFKEIITNGLLVPEDIAVDYVARNLYLTDSGLKQVMVCRIDGSICHALHKVNVDKPRAVALDPTEGHLYWSDWGNATGIHRSNMDGSSRMVLVWRDIQWPNGITIDHTTSRLYWCDAKIYRIEYITLDGKIRKIILQDRVFHPFSLAVFEDTLYWTDWNTYSIDSCNKFTGHNQALLIRERKHILGVHIYHPVLSVETPNPCWMTKCSHICVISPVEKYKCVCPTGFQLSDATTCSIDDKSPQLFISEKSTIFHLQPEAVGNDVIKELPILHLQTISDIAFNWKTKTLFVSDKDRRVIVKINISSMQSTLLVKDHIESVEELAYDWSGDNLFWIDSVKGTVEVLSLNTSARAIILSNLARPLAIELAPAKGLMFISDVGGRQPHVAMYDMDGTNKIELADVTGLPISLTLHPKESRLFWTDPKTETITSIDYLNSPKSKIVHAQLVSHVTSIAVSGKFLYWVDSQTHIIKLMALNDSRRIVHTHLLPGNATGTIVRKTEYVYPSVGASACGSNNGGCSDICVTKPSGSVCACAVGKIIGKDNKHCEASSECSPNEFQCKSTTTCFPLSYRCDDTPDCDDGSDEEGCELSFRCPSNDFQCRNGRCIVSSWKCDSKDDCGDGSDEQGCAITKGCPSQKLMCNDGHCIPDLWRCDGERDCNDNSDEESCHEIKCNDNQFRCDHGQCIPTSWVCDGSNDCVDGTDESKDKCEINSINCRPTEFRCGNGLCIDKALVCDRRNDCEDNSDEANCALNSTCRNGMFRCSDGTCIYDHEVCDGHNDCDNDEITCSSTKQCHKTEYLCMHNNRCIPNQWVCDGDKDCADGSDELTSCHYKSTTLPPPIKDQTCDQFTCNSGECLPWVKICNEIPDCMDYSDEGTLCGTSCSKSNGGCSHLCSPSPSGARCSCLAGYKLLPDQKTCDDEDECSIAGMCSQFCNNTKGGFKCFCSEGYFLTRDHRKCKADGGPATLVYLLPDQIRALELSSHSQKLYLQGDRTDMRGLDYDAADGVFFWSEWKEGTLNKYNVGSNRNDAIVHDIKRPYYVKWDWIAKNVYYTNGEASIMVCSRTGEFCTHVIKTIGKTVNSFELAPLYGVMFWSIWNEVRDAGPGLIERSDMDGSGRITILSDKIFWPSAVTVDNVLEIIYWTDVKLQIMESADFHGLNRKVVVRNRMNYPFSMAVFEDYVYWADWGTDTIFRCNKFNGEECLQLHKGDVKAETMIVVHKVKQPQRHNPCFNSECPQMCLQKSGGFSCHCDRKFEFRNGTCVLKAVKSGPTTKPKLLAQVCSGLDCQNNGKCVYRIGKKMCDCTPEYYGENCEIKVAKIQSRYDYSWVIAVLLGSFAVIAIILVILLCRQNRSKIAKLSDSVAVTFRNPRYLFRKRGLIMDTDDMAATADDLMLGKKGAYTSTFGNPLFNQRPYLDPAPEDGDYKRWPSYDSDDSAFVSEYYCREDSNLTMDQTAMSSKDKIIQFFTRI